MKMTPENFCYWLQGWFELNQTIDHRNGATPETLQVMQDHLALVFNKVTPERDQETPYSDEKWPTPYNDLDPLEFDEIVDPEEGPKIYVVEIGEMSDTEFFDALDATLTEEDNRKFAPPTDQDNFIPPEERPVDPALQAKLEEAINNINNIAKRNNIELNSHGPILRPPKCSCKDDVFC